MVIEAIQTPGVAIFPCTIRETNNYSLVGSQSQKSMKVKAASCSMVEMAQVSSIPALTLKVRKIQKNRGTRSIGSIVCVSVHVTQDIC